MTKSRSSKTSRRNFLKLALGASAFGPFFLFPDRAAASQKTLKIAKWAHFLPEFDQWFVNVVAKDWGTQNDTKVTVDIVPVEEVRERAFTEAKASKGHDIFIFPWPPAEFYRQAIEHDEVYDMVAGKYGAIQQLAFRSTINAKTKTHFAFADFYMPTPLHFFQDYWAEVGMPLGPVHYFSLRGGGRELRKKLGVSSGLAFSSTLEGNITLHTILYAFRAWLLDARGNVLFSKNAFAVTALKYIQALYQESGSPEQLTWSSGGNIRAMLARKTSSSTNAISLLRTAEKRDPELAAKIRLQPPLLGTHQMGVTALPHVTNCSLIWKFAQNQAGAKQFLADLIDSSRTGYEQSKGCNFPIYPKTVPDLILRLQKDPQADPPYKYVELQDALHWTPNLGVPGFASPAYMEIFNSSLVPKMVARMLKGEQSAEDAAASGAAEMQRIVDKWN
ncbi:MAG TPA: carbohydrate ABC transporter substrate-binding protein [Candidatus Angelobacter sp.]|nr:carbohydrate ABC transporter substrate-binding protein [Candidatus Angelobacter sp.]